MTNSSSRSHFAIDHTKLAAARLRAAEVQPFLAVALYALVPVPTDAVPTFAVDRNWRLFVNPERLDEWSSEQVAGVLLHEVGHVVRDHAGRAVAVGVDESTAFIWNLAGDAEINDDLVDDRLVMPAGIVLPRTLGLPRHKAAEFYFWKLLAKAPPRLPHVDCGEGCHGVPAKPLGLGHGELPDGVDPVDQDLLRRRVAELVLAMRGTAPGTGHSGWERWAEAVLHPVVDWRRRLRAAIRSGVGAVSGAVDYSYGRPSRRRVEHVVLPSLRRPLPRVGIVVDTSGSMSDRHLDAAWTEVLGVLRSLGVRRDLLTVWATDARAVRLEHAIGRRAALTGGGGTDMGVGIAAAVASRPRPSLVVVLTDGETPWPAKPPVSVVVALVRDGAAPWPPPPWATVVQVPLDDVND